MYFHAHYIVQPRIAHYIVQPRISEYTNMFWETTKFYKCL